MRLHPKPFDEIKLGFKTTEVRLNDTKRKAIKVGDTIKFLKRPKLKESIVVKVKRIRHIHDYKGLEEYYSEDEREKWGFVIFEFNKPLNVTT